MGRHVTIGNLKNIVADTFLGKQKTNLSVAAFSSEKENNFYEDECIDPPEELQTQILLVPILKFEKLYVECVNARFAEKYLAWLKAVSYKRFQLFYFY